MSCLRAILFISCTLVFISGNSQAQTTRRVPADHPTIQQAINASVNGDTVLVAPGTYVENINFLGKAITVTSEAGPQLTIIDGNQAGPVVRFISGEGRSSILSGFTLQNGSFSDSLIQGGGIRMINSSPTVTQNIITKNAACEGIGISINSGSPLIQNNVITENDRQLCSGGFGGGGIFVFNGSTAQILDNTITKNFLNSRGGGISILSSSPTILRNLISDNGAGIGHGISVLGSLAEPSLIEGNTISFNRQFASSGGPGGGGICLFGGGTAHIINNVISNNSTDNGVGGGGISNFGGGETLIQGNTIANNSAGPGCCGTVSGGGIYINTFTHQQIIQNLIINNFAQDEGGGVWGAGFTLVNNTIADNDAQKGSGLFTTPFVGNNFINNIIVAKSDQTAVFCSMAVNPGEIGNFRFNNVFSPGGAEYGGDCPDLTGTNGNISADPRFVDPANGDYHLRPDSPSVDRGTNDAPNLPATDIDGDARILDGNNDGVATVDMGVDEVIPQESAFDICIQSGDSVLRINSETGDYQFTNCKGVTLSGTGTLRARGCTITFQHNAPDSRILAMINTCQNRGTATVQVLSPRRLFNLSDPDITDGCGCN